MTRRSRLLGMTEANATHAQVNRLLLDQFADLLAADPWDIALLQEAPPRWLRALCCRTHASGASALTSRNLGALTRGWVADRRPDLIGSAEGGSNMLLVRRPWRIDQVRRLTLTRRPERRRMLWARVAEQGGRVVAVANLHASAHDRLAATAETMRGAERADDWATTGALIFGGDLNLRPLRDGPVFAELEDRFGLSPPTAADAIDHLLVRGLLVIESPRQLEPAWREVEYELRTGSRRLVRLSDHAPVVAELALP